MMLNILQTCAHLNMKKGNVFVINWANAMISYRIIKPDTNVTVLVVWWTCEASDILCKNESVNYRWNIVY